MNVHAHDPDSPLLVLHSLYGEVFRHLRPEAPAGAIVYEVDAGLPDVPNLVFVAAEVTPDGQILGEPIEVIVAKDWVKAWFEARGADCASDLAP